jgi:hypothetical protein
MIKISIREAFGWFAVQAKEFALSPIPNSQRVSIMLQRMAEDLDRKRVMYHAALQEVVAIQNPDNPDIGRLPSKRRRIETLSAQGVKWAGELETVTEDRRRVELNGLLAAAAQECEKLKTDVAGLETLLATNQQTLKLREGVYHKAKADYLKLKSVAPALVAQTDALKVANAQRMEALEAAGENPSTNPAQVLNELQQELEAARAGEQASQMIEFDDTPVDLDAAIAKETGATAESDLVDCWKQQAAAARQPKS